jgi:hypothetical protein
MKKIMMTLALALAVSTMYAITGEEAINRQALQSFRTDFAGAIDATWTPGKNYYKVSFTMNEQKLFAYYNMSGEFIAVTRYISSFQLPLYLQNTLKKSYENYWISDLFEMSNPDGTSYYVTLETADSRLVLRSTDGRDWSVDQKLKKA